MDENSVALETNVATSQETDGAPETSEGQSNGGNYGEIFKSLEAKIKDNRHYEPTEEEWAAFEKMNEQGKPKEEDPEADLTGDSKEPEPEKSVIPEDILKKVGAKSTAELGPKIDGLLSKLKEFNDERGTTGSKLKEFEQKQAQNENALQNQHNLLVGVLNGDQKAIEQARQIMEKNGIKVNPKTQQSFEDFGFSAEDLENAVDAPVIKGMASYIKKLESKLEQALSKADEVTQTITAKSASDEAWRGVVNEFAEVGEKFFADQGLRGPAVRQLMRQWKEDGQPPEAIKPLVELAKYADEQGVSLEKAFKLKDYDELPRRLQNKTTKAPIAKPSVGLSDKQGKAVQNNTHREYSGAQLEQMWKTGNFPSGWMVGDQIDPTKVPDYAQAYFEQIA